jgi:hypothetical protein
VVVISRLNPVRFDGGDIPSIAEVERRSQLILTDGVRASVGTIVTEAQHIQGSIVLGHRRQARYVSWSLVAVEGVKQSAVQHRLKRAPQTLQMERVGRSECTAPANPPSMPTALLLAAAGQYPKVQGRHDTTHPRAVPSAVRDWSVADH